MASSLQQSAQLDHGRAMSVPGDAHLVDRRAQSSRAIAQGYEIVARAVAHATRRVEAHATIIVPLDALQWLYVAVCTCGFIGRPWPTLHEAQADHCALRAAEVERSIRALRYGDAVIHALQDLALGEAAKARSIGEQAGEETVQTDEVSR